mgnify:CR=1 FL=1
MYFYYIYVTNVAVDFRLLTTKCDCGLAKKIGPAEFDIAISVLDLVYCQALVW